MRITFRAFASGLPMILLLLQSMGPVTAVSYVPGMKSGDRVSFSVNSSNTGSRDPAVAPFLNTASVDMIVTGVSGQDVLVNQLWKFTNGTEDRAIVLSGNVGSGAGNQTVFGGVRWLIAGRLNARDLLFPSAPPNMNVTGTVSASYAGASRIVNLWNLTHASPSFTEVESHVWDKSTGLLLERTYLVSYPGVERAFLDIKAVQTSIPFPDFTLMVDQSTVNVTSDTEGASTIKLGSLNGFNTTVQLTVAPSPGLTCSLTPASLLVDTTATSTLKCKASPGAYIAKLNATAGTLFHTSQVAFHSTALTPQTGAASAPAPIILYALIGAGLVATAVLTGFAILRNKRTRRAKLVGGKESTKPVSRPRSKRSRRRSNCSICPFKKIWRQW
ncbi:MAG TPA: hypothetical protein VFE98_08365 [Candidatus Bathyarchaeia archaeon]|nr:hypothetical protein [Candidatus Bathyarchaeia archaeon]